MLKVVLVDDDEAILSGLRRLIDWEKYGCRIEETFQNSLAAYAYCAQHAPDLVITDIRMPGVSGLDLISRLRQASPGTLFVMLTAYDDFDYAKQALNSGAFRYLLKPVDEAELIQTLQAAAAALQNVRSTASERLKLQTYLHTHQCLECLYDLLSLVPPPTLTRETAVLYENHVLAPYRMAVVRYSKEPGNRKILESSFPIFYISAANYDTYILVGSQADPSALLNTLSVFMDSTAGHCAVSALLPSLKNLYRDNASLRSYLDGKIFSAEGHIFVCPPSAAADKREQQEQWAAFLNLLNGFTDDCTHGDLHELRQKLKEIAALFACAKFPPSPAAVRSAFLDTLNRLSGYYRQYFSDPAGLSGEIRKAADDVQNSVRLRQILDVCLHLSEHLFSELPPVSGTSSMQIVNMAKTYIELHLCEEINIKNIAQAAYVSPSYLSSLFKKATGEKLWSYVIRVRLENAYDYLKNTDMRIGQVAHDCGFQNLNTFYYSFKKQYGFAPGRFRQQENKDAPDKG